MSEDRISVVDKILHATNLTDRPKEMLPLFKYTSSRASPLPPSKASSGFVAAAAAANGASRDYLAQAARFDSNLQQQKQQQQWQKQQTTQTQLSYVTRSFSSNLQLFNTNGQPAQAPKLADQFMTGGSGDGSTLTRERTMELYRLHPSDFDVSIDRLR